jgi:tetratricopeptide (TPR) repeat protein
LAYYGRGNAWIGKGEGDKAILDYNEAIRLDPKCALLYCGRGSAWWNSGNNDKAISDYTEASRLDPTYALAYGEWLADAYMRRGLVWQAKGDNDKALTAYGEAIRLRPEDASAYDDRGTVWLAKQEFNKAISDFNEAIRLDPENLIALSGRAWIAATCPDVRYRDGRKAVDDATKACELTGWKEEDYLDTLAAAYAANGDFPNAVKWQQKAIELAPEESKGVLRSRLDLYKAHKSYRDNVKKQNVNAR